MEQHAKWFRVLSDPIRLKLAVILSVRGETCVCELAEAVNEPHFKVSRHLGVMRSAGMVDARREGTWMHYSFAEPSSEFANKMKSFLADVVAADESAGAFIRRLKGRRREPRIKVLFLCTGNSCRSRMAEEWAKHLKPDILEAYSAGMEKNEPDPHAVKVMKEAGVDISRLESKTVFEVLDKNFDWVITLCSDAQKKCPGFPGKARVIRRPFEDPPELAKKARTEEESLAIYRRVRDEIREFVERMPGILVKKGRKDDR